MHTNFLEYSSKIDCYMGPNRQKTSVANLYGSDFCPCLLFRHKLLMKKLELTNFLVKKNWTYKICKSRIFFNFFLKGQETFIDPNNSLNGNGTKFRDVK